MQSWEVADKLVERNSGECTLVDKRAFIKKGVNNGENVAEKLKNNHRVYSLKIKMSLMWKVVQG